MTLQQLINGVITLHGRLSATDVTTITSLIVSSVAVIVCVVLNRQPETALGLYLGAWVTHAGVQGHQRLKSRCLPPDEGDDHAR